MRLHSPSKDQRKAVSPCLKKASPCLKKASPARSVGSFQMMQQADTFSLQDGATTTTARRAEQIMNEQISTHLPLPQHYMKLNSSFRSLES